MTCIGSSPLLSGGRLALIIPRPHALLALAHRDQLKRSLDQRRDAAEMSADSDAAARYYAQLLDLASRADTDRPELQHASVSWTVGHRGLGPMSANRTHTFYWLPARGENPNFSQFNCLRRAKSRLEIVRRPIFSWPRTGSDGHSDASGAHDGTGGSSRAATP